MIETGITQKYFLMRNSEIILPPQKAKIETREAVRVRISKLNRKINMELNLINLFLTKAIMPTKMIRTKLRKAARS